VGPAVGMLNAQRSELRLYADAPPWMADGEWWMVDGETDGGSATEIPGLGCVHVSTRKTGAASSRRYALSSLSSVRPCRRVPLAPSQQALHPSDNPCNICMRRCPLLIRHCRPLVPCI
jgi:hypothetical protein